MDSNRTPLLPSLLRKGVSETTLQEPLRKQAGTAEQDDHKIIISSDQCPHGSSTAFSTNAAIRYMQAMNSQQETSKFVAQKPNRKQRRAALARQRKKNKTR